MAADPVNPVLPAPAMPPGGLARPAGCREPPALLAPGVDRKETVALRGVVDRGERSVPSAPRGHDLGQPPALPARGDEPPQPPVAPGEVLSTLLGQGVTWGDSARWLPALPAASVDLWFTSPPYADARAYSRIEPERYAEWFLPYGQAMLRATTQTGWLVLNIKNRVARSGPYRGQRHPYVYQLVLALQQQGWRWLETYVWFKPNAVPGRYGPRTKDSFEYVYALARGPRPYFDLDAVRVPYKTAPAEIERRKLDRLGRRNTGAGFGRDRTTTYLRGGADPGNVVCVPQTYNQHKGAGGHTAAMPEGLAEFFVRACSPAGGVVIDPFAGSGTTAVAARRLGRAAGGLEIHKAFADAARQRLCAGSRDGSPVVIQPA
jgi:DNA modification methylase